MKLKNTIALLFSGLMSCTSIVQESDEDMKNNMLYQSDAFTVYSDRVVQGFYEAAALNPTSMISNYQSPANEKHTRGVAFKFSLNGKDNELPAGVDHFMVLYPEDGTVISPVITFGEQYVDTTKVPQDNFLESNTKFKIRLDMSPVMKAFKEKGYYENYAGDKIYKGDFKGVYVAGNAEPLSWDFENLPSREGLQMKDADGDGIYETTITLNQYNPENFTASKWELKEDISKYPQYKSKHVLLDALYNLSLEEMKLDVRPDSTFMAGEKWNGVWTRDISYSILLSMAAIEPEISKKSLMRKVSNGRIIQDTGTGGSWPVSTDRVTWALAAWEVYKVTGDKEWLKQSYGIIKNTAEDDLKNAYDEKRGLFLGESSFLDWRKQSYPDWMNPVDIYNSENLGTNAVHYQTYYILSQMAKLLGESSEKWDEIAGKVKNGINEHLWLKDKNYYGQYLYGRTFLTLSPRAEALGESLTILFDIADADRQQKVVSNTPVTTYGIPSIYPQIPGIQPYHNNGIWPFVQAYWNWAAAKTNNEQALLHGLGSLYRQAALFLTNKENLVAESGDFKGTEINSDRQLWSVAGNLAMVYRIFFGMDFEPDGIRVRPVVPEVYAGPKELNNFNYRNAVLSFKLNGWGSEIESIKLDGKDLEKPFIPGDLTGKHTIEINLSNKPFQNKPFNLTNNLFTLPAPTAVYSNKALNWKPVEGAVKYLVFKNGEQTAEVKDKTSYEVGAPGEYAEYQVAAVDEAGLQSFLSEPLEVVDQARVQILEAEKYAKKANLNYAGFSGQGGVQLSKKENTDFNFAVTAPEEGSYLIDFKYSNGSGPINTDNKAAIRSLFKNGSFVDAVVFPQRGNEEWSNWGYSNALRINLDKGSNELSLRFMPYNENMNREVNKAMLDYIRIIKLD